MKKVLRAFALVVTLAAGVLIALPTSPAAAANRLQIHTHEQFFVASKLGERITGTAFCGVGERVVSASFSGGEVVSLIPTSQYDGVTASAIMNQGGRTLLVQAVCAPSSGLSGVVTRTRVFSGTSGTPFRRGVVTCPAGTVAFGGGSRMLTSSGAVSSVGFAMVSNGPGSAGNTWTAAASTRSSGDQLEITTQCASFGNSFFTSSSTPMTPGSSVTNDKACPSGYTVLSGGVYLARADGTEAPGVVTQSQWADHLDGITSWRVTASSSTPNTKAASVVRCIA